MRAYTLLSLVIVAPFVVGAVGLWIWERRKVSRRDSFELEELLEELGFRPQETHFAGREIHHPFRRDSDEVDCFSDGGSTDVAFRVKGKSMIVSYVSNAAIAALSRNHPEILNGEFQALIVAESAAKSRARANQAQS